MKYYFMSSHNILFRRKTICQDSLVLQNVQQDLLFPIPFFATQHKNVNG